MQVLPPEATQGSFRTRWVFKAPRNAGDSRRALAEGLGTAAASEGFTRVLCSPRLWDLGTLQLRVVLGMPTPHGDATWGLIRVGTGPEPRSQLSWGRLSVLSRVKRDTA